MAHDLVFAHVMDQLNLPKEACKVHLKAIYIWPNVFHEELVNEECIGDVCTVKQQRSMLSLVFECNQGYAIQKDQQPASVVSRHAYLSAVKELVRGSLHNDDHAALKRGLLSCRRLLIPYSYNNYPEESAELIINQVDT